ncbi:unnamed protein product [Linum trigynum]|uniref:CASP-like protein n=1 Tax=Linum trigynum TaxID=586398 RepID=A0AAV2F1W6_9ROSI
MEHKEHEPKKQQDDIQSPPPGMEEEEEGEDHYEIESPPPQQVTDSIQQYQLETQNNRNISHPPPPSLLHYYSPSSYPPQPPPHQQQQQAAESPPQLLRVLEARSPESPPIAPMPVASGPPKAAPDGGGGGAPPPPPPAVDGGGRATRGRRLRPNLSIMRKAKFENVRRGALLVSRISGFVFCLISLAVLAADKDQGWALESFYRYKEFRYCLTVNVVGFVYSGVQAFDLAYSMLTKRVHSPTGNRLRDCFDFSLDQIIAYLLLSASTSAAFRVEDWESNWGSDEFSAMARASLVLSFLAFVAFASSSILSGYTLFTSHSL